MLTREQLRSGAYLESFQRLRGQPCWPRRHIEASMQDTLAQRRAGEPVWLFAYGSLIWNPLFKFEEQRCAVLHDWHRSFCIRLLAGRGSHSTPGRMLALKAGGQSTGIAFRLAEKDLHEELWLVWVREMVHGLYRPVWGTIDLASGQAVRSLAFVAETTHPQYEGDAPLESTAQAIATARGHLGSNVDYLLQLEGALSAHDLHDPYIKDLAAAVRAIPACTPTP